MIHEEHLYLAAPVCFYPRGSATMWQCYRKEAEFYGAVVELPNDRWEEVPGDSIEERIVNNCDISMRRCTAVLANIENHRGFMPDAGTVFEIGMAYGLGLKCYAYTRDKRPMGAKYMGGIYDYETISDKDGEVIENMELPFSDCLVGACKIVEGNFTDCFRTFREDVEEESRQKAMRGRNEKKEAPVRYPGVTGKPVVYLGDCRRGKQAEKRHAEMKKVLEKYGFEAYTPSDPNLHVPMLQQSEDPYTRAYNRFDHYQQHVRDCDIYLAVLDDHRGYEVDSDVAFESGMAFMLDGKKMYGYIETPLSMAERTFSTEGDGDSPVDINGWTTEANGYPVNMMWGKTEIFRGMPFEEAVKKMAEKYGKENGNDQ